MRRTVIKNGFTLVEVIVAAALLGIAIVPILKALTQANLNSVIIERRTQSLCLAQGKLNQIKARSIYNFDNIFNESEPLGNSYLCKTTITGSGDLKTVKVSVGRLDGSGMSDEVTLQTQIARRWQ